MRKTILILRIGSLGDTVVALPAFHHVRRSEPDTRIVLLTNLPADGGVKAASSYQVLAGSGLIDAYAEYRTPRSLADVWSLFHQLREFRPRRIYYLMPQRTFAQRLRDRLFFLLAGVVDVQGLSLSKRFEKRGYLGHLERWEPESLRLLRMAGGRDTELIQENFSLNLTLAERGRASQVLAPLAGNPYLVVSLGTKLPVKDWGDDYWLTALRHLGEGLLGTGLVLIGSADESERCARLARAWRGAVINLCGQLTPRESGAVAASAVAFLGHDSGPAHLAAAVGAKVITIFSSRNLAGVWFPFGNEDHGFYERTDCANCGLDECVAEKMRCIRSITPEQVVKKTLSVAALASECSGAHWG